MTTAAARKEHLKCSICFELYNKPRTLPCLHTFCETCLQNFIFSNKSVEKFNCPVCRHLVKPPTPGKPQTEWAVMFPINFDFQSLIELEVAEKERNSQLEQLCSCGVGKKVETELEKEEMTRMGGRRFTSTPKRSPAPPQSGMKPQARKVKQFCVSLPSDKTDAFISGAACLNNNEIIVCDHKNGVKVFSLEGVNTDMIKLNYPRDVTVVAQSEVAVSLPFEKKIQFLLTKPKLSKSDCIKTVKRCFAISYCNDEFLVTCGSCHPAEIQILNMEGQVKRAITSDTNGNTFSSLYFAAFSNTGSLLACDQERGVIGMDVSGRVLFEYKDISSACGIAVNKFDNMYVCGMKSGDVHYLDSTGKGIQVLLSRKDDVELTQPYALCCSQDGESLFVFQNRSSRRMCFKYKIN